MDKKIYLILGVAAVLYILSTFQWNGTALCPQTNCPISLNYFDCMLRAQEAYATCMGQHAVAGFALQMLNASMFIAATLLFVFGMYLVVFKRNGKKKR